jgi:hypothetical protein
VGKAKQSKAKQKRAVLTCCKESTALQRCNDARTDTTTCNEHSVQAEGIVERKDMVGNGDSRWGRSTQTTSHQKQKEATRHAVGPF